MRIALATRVACPTCQARGRCAAACPRLSRGLAIAPRRRTAAGPGTFEGATSSADDASRDPDADPRPAEAAPSVPRRAGAAASSAPCGPAPSGGDEPCLHVDPLPPAAFVLRFGVARRDAEFGCMTHDWAHSEYFSLTMAEAEELVAAPGVERAYGYESSDAAGNKAAKTLVWRPAAAGGSYSLRLTSSPPASPLGSPSSSARSLSSTSTSDDEAGQIAASSEVEIGEVDLLLFEEAVRFGIPHTLGACEHHYLHVDDFY